MKDFSQYKLNVKKSPFDPRTYKAAKFLKAYTFPAELDMRDVFDKYFPIFDQGSQGSCAACAGTAMRQWQEYIDTTLTLKLSEQFIYNNREELGEEGMYMQNLMSILFKVGVCLDKLCIYGDLKKPTAEAYRDALKRLVKGYAQIESIDEFKQALYSQGPCVIAVPVYNYTERMWYQRAGDQFLGGHAMCCVGYTKDGFIIRNSWSDEWGQKGYAIMPYNDFPWIWETWTTIDADTNTSTLSPTTTPKPEPKKKLSWWQILILILATTAIITVGTLLLLR
jgi:hypothetical protein